MNLIYIIGPARTGTSALTTLVENMGAVTLPVTVVGKHNPNYQENAIVNALGEAIHHWASLEPNNMRRFGFFPPAMDEDEPPFLAG